MSKKRQVITVSPPESLDETGRTERMRSEGHECTNCHGNGWIWRLQDGEKDWGKESCPVCGGSGSLDALITIQWVAFRERGEV